MPDFATSALHSLDIKLAIPDEVCVCRISAVITYELAYANPAVCTDANTRVEVRARVDVEWESSPFIKCGVFEFAV